MIIPPPTRAATRASTIPRAPRTPSGQMVRPHIIVPEVRAPAASLARGTWSPSGSTLPPEAP